ncbi:unnamed protein product [Prunus armeniaca]|uniref:Uncharacterized protein n=1 Tax=Prunus armeniaca TaxID=36596 RepID=A0A6J5VEG5_PRUAR|nr:unnamed protein product [Prunus armeniaca]
MAEAEDDHKIVMESDSRALVDGLKGNLGNRVWTVPRNLNRAAHEAARIGVRAAGVDHWPSWPPLSLV